MFGWWASRAAEIIVEKCPRFCSLCATDVTLLYIFCVSQCPNFAPLRTAPRSKCTFFFGKKKGNKMKFLINIDIFIMYWVKNAIKTEYLSKQSLTMRLLFFFYNGSNLNYNCHWVSVQFGIRARKWSWIRKYHRNNPIDRKRLSNKRKTRMAKYKSLL